MQWEKNIFGFVPQDEWLNVGFNVTRQNDPIDRLFGDVKTDNLVAYWQTIAAEYQIPMMAQFHSFDTQTLKTFRVPVDTHNIEKGLIKVKINQSERMRALLRSGVREDAMYDYVINDGVRLAEQVFTRSKVAKNELMASGQVTIHENNLDLTVDYGVDAYQKAFTIDVSEGADIFAQIQDIVDAARSVGKIINGMMTSRKVISKIRKNEHVQIAIGGVYTQGAIVRQSALEAYLSDEFGINTIVTNDLTYGADASFGDDGRPVITTERYFPEDKITFFATNPAGNIGTGLWGDPPEVDIARFMDVRQSGVSPYVFVSQWIENDPTVLWTRASGLFMPVLYDPASLWIATVEDSEGDLEEITVTSTEGNASGKTNVAISGYTPEADESYVYKYSTTETAPDIAYGDTPDYTWSSGTFPFSNVAAGSNKSITVASVNGNGKVVAAGSAVLVIKA